MRITVVTLFPDMFSALTETSIIKRAITGKAVTLSTVNPRDFTTDRYKTVDDHPYGGGAGMILKVDVMDRAISYARTLEPDTAPTVVLLDPQGIAYGQRMAREFAAFGHLILVAGHYEGFDERIRSLVDREVSVGDFVVTGGEIPAMLVCDSVIRLLPGVLKKSEATEYESFESGLLEYPQYTRPESYNGMNVPDVLLSGNHAGIAAWRAEESLKRTKARRPDMLTPTRKDA